MSRKPVQAFEIYCDGCGEQFESADYTIFTETIEEWLDDGDWKHEGGIDLCDGCVWKLESLCEALAGEA